MSPEYTVFIPEASSQEFEHAVNAISGAEIKKKIPTDNRLEYLIDQTKTIVTALPKDTRVLSLHDWRDNESTPETWKSFLESLTYSQRATVIASLSFTKRNRPWKDIVIGDKERFEDLITQAAKFSIGQKKKNFIRKVFIER